jgi:type II secretory pathway component PulC
VDVDVHEPTANPADHRSPTPWLLPLISGIALAGVICSAWLVSSLQRSRLELERQQSVALIERLRDQLAAQETRAEVTAMPKEAAVAIQSLEPLTLPIQQPMAAATESSDQASASIELIPQLTGVVQGPDSNSSAIFGLGQSSVSAGIGDAIGSSGWVLTAVTDNGAVISRNGRSHTLSVGGLF